MQPDADVIIRPFAPGDFSEIASITAEVFKRVSVSGLIEEMIGKAGLDWVAIKAAAIRRELDRNPQACFVAEAGARPPAAGSGTEERGRVVGYVTNVIDRAASRGTIANLAVRRAYQGSGLGRRLIARSLEHFRALGLMQAKIETLACNPVGQHLYTSMGFREVVRQIHYVKRLR